MVSFFKKVKDFFGGSSPWNDQQPGYQTPADPYSLQWDRNTGRPIGMRGAPDDRYANRYQWRADEVTAEANAGFRAQARGYMDQAIRLGERYRPGGRMLASAGLYSGAAQTALASQFDSPDMLADARAHATMQANKAAKRAERLTMAGSIISAAASVLAAPMTGGASLAGLPNALSGIGGGGNRGTAQAGVEQAGGSQQAVTAPAGEIPKQYMAEGPNQPGVPSAAMLEPGGPGVAGGAQPAAGRQPMQSGVGGPGVTPGPGAPGGGGQQFQTGGGFGGEGAGGGGGRQGAQARMGGQPGGGGGFGYEQAAALGQQVGSQMAMQNAADMADDGFSENILVMLDMMIEDRMAFMLSRRAG